MLLILVSSKSMLFITCHFAAVISESPLCGTIKDYSILSTSAAPLGYLSPTFVHLENYFVAHSSLQ